MAVGIRVTCDSEGCGRHFELDALHAAEVADLSASSAGVWVEVLLNVPAGWSAHGSTEGFVVLCAQHTPTDS